MFLMSRNKNVPNTCRDKSAVTVLRIKNLIRFSLATFSPIDQRQ